MKERDGGIKREKGEEKERGKRCKKYDMIKQSWKSVLMNPQMLERKLSSNLQ